MNYRFPEPPEEWSEDECEALSERYDNKSIIVRRLTSGRLAVYDRAYDLQAIVNTFSEIEGLTIAEPQSIIEPATQPVRPALAHLKGVIKL